MSDASSPLLARDVCGPYAQVLDKLQGEDGRRWLAALEGFLARENPWTVSTLVAREFPVTLDYGRSVQQMIDAGRYDWVNDEVNGERFPVKGEGTKHLVLRLLYFNRGVYTEQAALEMKRRGLRAANLEELLAFGAAWPREQIPTPIGAIASSAEMSEGGVGVPTLSRDGAKRRLSVYWWKKEWQTMCRFLCYEERAR